VIPHTHLVTHQLLARTTPWVNPGKKERRAWQVRGLSAAVAGIAIAATLAFWSPDGNPGGDPGGVRQLTLRSISVALPGDAKVQVHSAGGPIWDSCDGRPETRGWGDVVNDYQFTSAGSAATVVAGVEAKMKIAGWKLASTPTKNQGPSVTPLGPSAAWTRTVSGDVVAQASLGVGSRGPNTASFWELDASAAPAGTRASGC
jgi:hypothetical protein